jgi:hypothetical protein
MGEVHTGLLRSSAAVSPSTATRLLGFVVGEKVRTFERPIPHAVSPERLAGVDCQLATPSGAKVRAIGTVVSRAAITGGHVVQGSAYVRVTQAAADRRLQWSHYLAQPGVIETIGKATGAQLADGFLNQHPTGNALDLGAIGARTLEAVQDSEHLNQEPPFKTQRTRLRWVLGPAEDATDAITFRLDANLVRAIRLPYRELDATAAAMLCEDFALHDWLLTTLLSLVNRTPIGSGDRKAVVDRLQPALDYLLHLWMPAARIDAALVDLWDALERRPGLSRQWQATVSRIRDQLALAAVVSPRP